MEWTTHAVDDISTNFWKQNNLEICCIHADNDLLEQDGKSMYLGK